MVMKKYKSRLTRRLTDDERSILRVWVETGVFAPKHIAALIGLSGTSPLHKWIRGDSKSVREKYSYRLRALLYPRSTFSKFLGADAGEIAAQKPLVRAEEKKGRKITPSGREKMVMGGRVSGIKKRMKALGEEMRLKMSALEMELERLKLEPEEEKEDEGQSSLFSAEEECLPKQNK